MDPKPLNLKFFWARPTSLAAMGIQNLAKMPFFEKMAYLQRAITRLLLGRFRPAKAG